MSAVMRRVAVIGAAVAGVVIGAVATTALSDPGAGVADPAPAVDVAVTSSTSTVPPTSAADPPVHGPAVLLVWTSGGLPVGLGAEVAAFDGVDEVTVVAGGEVAMTASADALGNPVDAVDPGWHIPLDAVAVDPVTFPSFLAGPARATVGSLAPGQALLTDTSARLRRLDEGSTLRLAGTVLTVAGVIDDRSGGGAELVVAAADAERLGIATPRYLLVSYTGDRPELQRAVADRLDGRAVRFRSPAETTGLRHGDAVEPPAALKAAYGEFAIRDRSGRDVDIDPEWVERWIVTEPVPILGRVTCHRKAIGVVRVAMEELEDANLAHLVDASAFAGCYSARRTGSGQPLSHHAWGAAVDLNVDGNPRGSFSTQDPRLVLALTRHGFTWGGTWLVPDPAHYEAPLPPLEGG